MIENLNIDQDGVMYDFYGAYAKLDGFTYQGRWFEHVLNSGLSLHDYVRSKFDEYTEKGLFKVGSPLNDTFILLEHISELRQKYDIKVNLLGALPAKSVHKNLIKKDKIDWLNSNGLRYYFDEIIYVNGSRSKIDYGNNSSILIDDFPKTQGSFKEKGYPFILHKSAKETIEHLNWFEFKGA